MVKTNQDAATTLPPAQAAAKQLERLLAGMHKSKDIKSNSTSSPTVTSNISQSSADTLIHSNPSKIVKRWLGTSSGTASSVTLADLSLAASVLFDPEGPCTAGQKLLFQLSPLEEDIAMDSSPTDSSGTGKQEEEPMQMDLSVPEKDMTTNNSTDTIGNKPLYLKVGAPEVEAWLLSMAIRILRRENRLELAMELSSKSIEIVYTHINSDVTSPVTSGSRHQTKHGLFPLLSRLYRFQALIVEGCLDSEKAMLVGLVRDDMTKELFQAHRLAVMRRDVDTQATILNILLRDLLNADQVEQAQKLLSNSTFPDSASNNQLCRYLYHSGRIQALRLEYTLAFSNLSQCFRKAPTNTGLGFRIAVQRLLIIVQLLMGEIPERSVFFTKGMVGELNPYLKITQAVRRGDLAIFHETVSSFSERLKVDGTFTLISRLAHSVVKAGLRKLNTSYSRISLVDVAKRLGLTHATSAEFVVAKAIRDNVIDGTIHHEDGYLQSHDLVDVYATMEPAEAFHRRIAYCLTTHNDAVRGMRYPPDAYKKQLEASRGLRGKKDEDKTDEEKAQELEDELDEDY